MGTQKTAAAGASKPKKAQKPPPDPDEERRKKNRARYRENRQAQGKPYTPGGRGRYRLPDEKKAPRKPSFSVAFEPEIHTQVSDKGGATWLRELALEALGSP